MGAGALIRMSNFRTPSASDGWPWRKRRWPAHPSRKSWSRTPTTASASSRSTTVRPGRAARARKSPIALDRQPARRRPRCRSRQGAGAGRYRAGRDRTCRWSSKARRTPSATACRGPAQALETVLDGVPLNRIQMRIDAHPSSRAMADWLVAFLSKRRVRSGKAQPVLRHRSGGDLRRHRPAAHVDRGAAGIDAAIAGAFLRDGRARRAAGGRRARLPQCRRHGGAGTRHHAGFGGLAISDCSRRRGRRSSMPRLISASRSASTRTSSCRWPRSGRCAGSGRACRRPARSPPRTATIHAETSFRMMTAVDPETNILRTTIAGFAAAAGGADSISILPHTIAHGLPAAFARRVARNAQLIMANESHVDHRRRSGLWFRRGRSADRKPLRSRLGGIPAIEAEGGVLSSLRDGHIQARVSRSRPNARPPSRPANAPSSAPRSIRKGGASGRDAGRRAPRRADRRCRVLRAAFSYP